MPVAVFPVVAEAVEEEVAGKTLSLLQFLFLTCKMFGICLI